MASLALPTPVPAANRPEAPLCPPPPARQRPTGCEQLNEDQLRAVTAPADGALIIFAPAGAGKTLTLVHRATWLVGRGLAAASVLCLTFSRKAAAELRGRLPPAAAGVEVCTFHAWCLRLLRAFAAELGRPAGFSLSSSAQQIELIRQALEAFQQQQGGGTSGASTAGTGTQARKSQSVMAACRRFQRVIGEAKLLPDGAPAGAASDKAPAASGKLLETEIGAFIWRHYNDGLRKAGLVDMGDLQRFALTLLRTPHVAAAVRGRYRHVLIDEYQDTNLQQLAIVRAICAKEPSAQTVGVTVVGDDDQVRGSSTLAVPLPPASMHIAAGGPPRHMFRSPHGPGILLHNAGDLFLPRCRPNRLQRLPSPRGRRGHRHPARELPLERRRAQGRVRRRRCQRAPRQKGRVHARAARHAR